MEVMTYKNCTKVSFCDENYADAYIKKLKKTSKRSLLPVRSYLCEKCLNWHLTSIEEKQKPAPIVKQKKMKPNQELLDKYSQLGNTHKQLSDKYNKTQEDFQLLKVCIAIIVM